jgi:hypothetical protein
MPLETSTKPAEYAGPSTEYLDKLIASIRSGPNGHSAAEAIIDLAKIGHHDAVRGMLSEMLESHPEALRYLQERLRSHASAVLDPQRETARKEEEFSMAANLIHSMTSLQNSSLTSSKGADKEQYRQIVKTAIRQLCDFAILTPEEWSQPPYIYFTHQHALPTDQHIAYAVPIIIERSKAWLDLHPEAAAAALTFIKEA